MSRLYLVMGLPGAGKTTLCHTLRAGGAVVLSPDAWMARLGLDGYDAALREKVKALQMDLATTLLALGCDVALDFGFFHRPERDAARALARAQGAEPVLIFLDPPFEELWRRIQARNAALGPETFPVSLDHLRACEGWLERPSPDEAALPGLPR